MSTSSPFGRRKRHATQTEVRIAIIGMNGVGKSAVTVRYLTKRFIGEYQRNAEMRYYHQTKIDGDIVSMEILDLGTHKILTESVLHWADGVFLMYSITDRRSIDVIRHIRFQVEEARNAKPIPLAFMLVANKADLVHQRRVPYSEGENLAKDMGCTFGEISASENYENILDVFLELYREIRMYKFGSRSSIFGRMFGHSREKKMLTL
ncbi:ras-related and estrogen-regulated growth inhibitor-like [Amphiura filiformis]|uniref:ras-related and estrogen-regulated growth inhibitor-like n=1 Tax=Amphiura filiformis TaxID=82378 RepID=UPI003B227F14